MGGGGERDATWGTRLLAGVKRHLAWMSTTPCGGKCMHHWAVMITASYAMQSACNEMLSICESR